MDGPAADSGATQQIEARILCADDTEAQRYAVSHVLRKAGFEVIEARTGREALALMPRQPNLVVLDVNLPDISGLEVCRIIKTSEQTKRTPILHVSATLVSAGARVAGLDGGADAYLVQPIEPEELIATVRALLRVRKAEEALWESQQEYRLFFEANPLPCWVFDTAQMSILAVNPAAVNAYGYSREEFVALRLSDIIVPAEGFKNDNCGETGVLTQLPDRGKHKTKTDRMIDVEMVCAPLRLQDRDATLVIVRDITEKLERQANEQKEQVRRLLLDRLLQAQEEERRRIARELHDEAGQLMTSLLVGLRTLSDARRLSDAKRLSRQMREIASAAIAELSRLARGLHSSVLEDLGLEVAIRRYVDELNAGSGLKVDLDLPENKLTILTREQQLNIYRIVQEALTNVARHSGADHASISFARRNSELLVTIRDNGRGFAVDSKAGDYRQHLGVEGMRERAAILGGSLEVISDLHKGVTILLQVPTSNSQELIDNYQ